MLAGCYLEFMQESGRYGRTGVKPFLDFALPRPCWPLAHQGVLRVAGGLVAFRPDLVFMAESGHPPVARGLDWLSG